jgi:hypothetical protein
LLVFTWAHALEVRQVVVARPLKELELADKHRIQPLAFPLFALVKR